MAGPSGPGLVALDLPVLLAVVAAAAAYALGVRAARARGNPWSAVTSLWFAAGLLALLATVLGPLGARQQREFGALAVQDVLLVTVVPLGLVLGRPWQLLSRARGAVAGSADPPRMLARLVTFPLTGSVLATVVLVLLYTTGWDAARLASPVLMELTRLPLLAAGCLLAWSLVGVGDGGGRVSYPVRVLVAGADGLLDALPGLVVLASGRVVAAQHYAGVGVIGALAHSRQQSGATAMVAVGELVDLPVLLVLLVLWVRSDERRAREVDLELTARSPVLPPGVLETSRPWWETDPGPLGDRMRRQTPP